jgi:hypothetical protein
MGKMKVDIRERELWLIDWIAENRHDLWDLNREQIIHIALREWTKAQFDNSESLANKAKKIREMKK